MTQMPTTRLINLASLWGLEIGDVVGETGIAVVHRASLKDGTPCALKLYKGGDPRNERNADVLRHWAGRSAARLLESAPDALLLEWASGPSLGDLSRTGRDEETAAILADVALALREVPTPESLDLPTLEHWYRDLLSVDLDSFPVAHRPLIAQAHSIAQDLFAQARPQILLHGDLHHDNVLESDRGWLAIDPKGIYGPPEAELANTYRNPKGGGDVILNPDRLQHMIAVFAGRLGYDPRQLLLWGAAKTALSAVWQNKAGQNTDPMPDLLPIMFDLLDGPLSEGAARHR